MKVYAVRYKSQSTFEDEDFIMVGTTVYIDRKGAEIECELCNMDEDRDIKCTVQEIEVIQ
jgi:hypothetical protein